MQYTKQNELGRFGERWGCFGTLPLSIVENEISRKVTAIELRTILGNWFLTENVSICNYKDHRIFEGVPERQGWGEKANPEYHFWMNHLRDAIVDVMWCLGVNLLHHQYDVLEWATDAGSHFVLRIDGGTIVNPDPSIPEGPIANIIPVMI